MKRSLLITLILILFTPVLIPQDSNGDVMAWWDFNSSQRIPGDDEEDEGYIVAATSDRVEQGEAVGTRHLVVAEDAVESLFVEQVERRLGGLGALDLQLIGEPM